MIDARITDQPARHDHDADYAALLTAVRGSFDAVAREAPAMLTVDTEGLWDAYLDGLPAERQVHTCHACRTFMRRFGGAVTVGDDGRLRSALWCSDVAPDFYGPALNTMRRLVESRPVGGVLIAKEATWGVPATGAWAHFAVTPPARLLHRDRLLTPGQAAAARREDRGTVARALAEFPPPLLEQALRVLEADALTRAERFIAPVRWLLDLHTARAAAPGKATRENLLWRAVASAPPGFCHPRSGVIGTLLEDIAAGLPFDDIKRRWADKMHPLRYQRPQAAPSAGNIAEAERRVRELGIAPSLERRFALLSEIADKAMWLPKRSDAPKPTEGVFGHLAPKDQRATAPLEIQAPVMTWEKFARTVLPTADALELLAPAHGSYMAMVTAAHADAPPILRWDRDDARNSASVYVYHGGSMAAAWGLASGWVPVEAVAARPNLWGDRPMPHLGDGIIMVLRGAEDSRTGQGNALFPENLRDDLHAIRATIEAYSRCAEIGRPEGQKASGYGVSKGAVNVKLRVRAGGGWTVHTIDRWD